MNLPSTSLDVLARCVNVHELLDVAVAVADVQGLLPWFNAAFAVGPAVRHDLSVRAPRQ